MSNFTKVCVTSYLGAGIIYCLLFVVLLILETCFNVASINMINMLTSMTYNIILGVIPYGIAFCIMICMLGWMDPSVREEMKKSAN